MYKRLLVTLLILLPYCISAQNRKPQNLQNYDQKFLHFGFTVGTNLMGFRITPSDNFNEMSEVYGIEVKTHPGIHLGPISNLRISDNFDLRALIVLSFIQRDLIYKLAVDPTTQNAEFKTHIMQMETSFFEVPVYIKYKADRINNYCPYMLAGVNFKYDMAAQKSYKDDELPKIRLKQMDIYSEFGAGVDFYLQYFKFAVELKYAHGYSDNILRDGTEYANAFKRLQSNAVVFSLHFGG